MISNNNQQPNKMSAMVEQECCICFEIIGEKNNCVTPCGHKFCFMCVTKSLSQNNTCPCCRSVLLEVEEDDDDSEYADEDDNDESDSDDGDSNDSDSDEEDDEGYAETSKDAEDAVDEIHEYLKKCGHTDKDIFGYFMGIRAKKTAKEFIGRMKKVHTDFLELQEKWVSEAEKEAEKEAKEQELFAAEDRPISV